MSTTNGAALLSAEDREVFLGKLTELGTAYKRHDDEFAKHGKANSETLERIAAIDKSLLAAHERIEREALKRIDSLELKLNESRQMTHAKSFGDRVVEHKEFVEFVREGKQGSYAISLDGWRGEKNIQGLSPLMPQVINTIASLVQVPFGVRQLVPSGRTTAGAIEYLRELTFTNAAAPVAEGASKPKSDKTFDVVSAVVRTIAHYFKVSRQSFEDLPALAAFVENNGIYGVNLAEDNQFLNGDGVAPNLQGLMPVATAAPAPVGTGANLIDAIGAAIFSLGAKGYMADGIVVNPADWGAVAMLKNSQGNYLFANPIDYAATARVWGARFVTSANMAAGNFLVGQFQGKAQILDRETVNAQVATQNEDDFIKNMYTIRVEERTVLLIFDAKAFEKGVVPAGAVGTRDLGASEPSEAPRRR